MSAALHTVHVRVNDRATGQPTPVRVRFAGPDGAYFPPLGRLAEFATDVGVDVGGNVLLGGKQYAYIDGTCEVRLPGQVPLDVEVSKGPEYRPLRASVTLPPGKLALRFEVERWIDLRAERWYSGDSNCHFLGPQGALLEAAGEDIAVVNLLAWDCPAWGEGGTQHAALPNILDFSGQEPARATPGHMVVVNTANRHASLGTLLLLNCHRAVYPLALGVPGDYADWTPADWCDQCHRKGGLVVGVGFFGSPGHLHGELLSDVVLGKVDALEVGDFENPDVDAQLRQESGLRDWFGLLDCGFRVPLVAGSCKTCNLDILGRPRTYARLLPGEELTYRNWVEAVRAGRTFLSNGPLLSFSVNGQDPGSVLSVPEGEQTLRLRAEARSVAPFAHLEVVANHQVVARADAAGDPATAVIDRDVALPAGGWLLARCWGPYDDVMEQWVAALTSPVYVQAAGQPARPAPATVARFLGHIDRMLTWVREKGPYETELQRQRVAAVFESAREALKARGGA